MANHGLIHVESFFARDFADTSTIFEWAYTNAVNGVVHNPNIAINTGLIGAPTVPRGYMHWHTLSDGKIDQLRQMMLVRIGPDGHTQYKYSLRTMVMLDGRRFAYLVHTTREGAFEPDILVRRGTRSTLAVRLSASYSTGTNITITGVSLAGNNIFSDVLPVTRQLRVLELRDIMLKHLHNTGVLESRCQTLVLYAGNNVNPLRGNCVIWNPSWLAQRFPRTRLIRKTNQIQSILDKFFG